MKSVFQLIFHYITKHQKIIHFSGIHFPKKNYFAVNKRDLHSLSNPRFSDEHERGLEDGFLSAIDDFVLAVKLWNKEGFGCFICFFFSCYLIFS